MPGKEFGEFENKLGAKNGKEINKDIPLKEIKDSPSKNLLEILPELDFDCANDF
jgi:hypothetical protein